MISLQTSCYKPIIQPPRVPLELQAIFLAANRGEEIARVPSSDSVLFCRKWNPLPKNQQKKKANRKEDNDCKPRLCFGRIREAMYNEGEASTSFRLSAERSMEGSKKVSVVSLHNQCGSFRWKSAAEDQPLQPYRRCYDYFMRKGSYGSLSDRKSYRVEMSTFSACRSVSSVSDVSYGSRTSKTFSTESISSLSSLDSSHNPRRSRMCRWTETKSSDKPLPRVPNRSFD